MKKNMGNVDKALRSLIALVIALLYFTEVITGIFAIILLVLAVVFLLTSMVSFCPLYTIFGMNTCKIEENKS